MPIVAGTRISRHQTLGLAAKLVRDGADLKAWSRDDSATTATFEYEDANAPSGEHWYYWRVEQEGISQHYGGNVATAWGNLAWSTPHWIRIQP